MFAGTTLLYVVVFHTDVISQLKLALVVTVAAFQLQDAEAQLIFQTIVEENVLVQDIV